MLYILENFEALDVLGPRAIRNSAREASMICNISTSGRLSRSFTLQQSIIANLGKNFRPKTKL